MFVDNGVAEDDPRMSAVYEHFEGNLRDIVDTLHAKGMHVVLSTVPVNLRQSAPSCPSVGMTSLRATRPTSRTRARRSAGAERSLAGGTGSVATGNLTGCWSCRLAFQLATSLEKLGEFALARTHYERALDLDGLRFRADTRINTIIERVAREYDSSNVSFVHSSRVSTGRAHLRAGLGLAG